MNSKEFEFKLAKLANEASKEELITKDKVRRKKELQSLCETCTKYNDCSESTKESPNCYMCACRRYEEADNDNAPTVCADLSKYSDKLWKEAYERGHKEGYELAILDGKTNFSRQEGEWINHRNDYGHNIADCSVCGKAMQWHDEDEDGIPRYCWFCGAKIKGVVKNE